MGIQMKKLLMATTAILTIASGAPAIAQESSGHLGSNAPMRFSVEDMKLSPMLGWLP
jgi:hypothetical protein